MNKSESATEKFRRHIWTTYKARYNAHRRVLMIDKIQKITLTIISVLILSISVAILNPSILGNEKVMQTNIFLIILSIILLALSLSIGQSDNKLNAYKFHNCARKLHRLFNYIEMEIEKDSNFQISSEKDKYNDILDQYELNHEKIDWDHVVYQEWIANGKSFIELIIFRLVYFSRTQLLYWLLIIFPLVTYTMIVLMI